MHHRKLRLSLTSSLAALLLVFASHTFAQDSDADAKTVAAQSLEMAKQISSASGRPIFAVAGRST